MEKKLGNLELSGIRTVVCKLFYKRPNISILGTFIIILLCYNKATTKILEGISMIVLQ